MRASRLLLSASLALGVAGCAGAQNGGGSDLFTQDIPRDSGIAIAKVEERLRAVMRPASVAVAVGVSANGLVGARVPGGAAWRNGTKVDTLPAVTANGVVVATGGGRVIGLEGATGRALFDVSADGYVLRGAADDGRYTVVSLGRTSRQESRFIAVERGGKVVVDTETDFALGRPAVRGGVALVPFRGQYVGAIELETGQELARALVRDLTSHALDFDGTLYFGQNALIRFDEKIRYAESFQATRWEWKPRPLPGKPTWLGDGFDVSRLDRTALAKIKVYAAPDPKRGGNALASDSYAGTYFRVVYGFHAKDGRVAWTDALPGDALGGAAAASGFVFCDATGTVHVYDERGKSGEPTILGAPLTGCRVGASGLVVSASRDRGSLAQQIDSTINSVDSTMAAAESLLIAELGKLEDPLVTRILIGFAESSRLPQAERDAARVLLAARRSGADDMLQALSRQYDFLSDEAAPPVGPLADALAAMGEERAAPLLAKHLTDPATSLDDVARAAKALETLATPKEAQALTTFFSLYRATADEPALIAAVLSGAKALLRVGGSEGRAVVERAANDAMTVAEVARGIQSLLATKPS
jgi:outer membrane protein assembly factor BamB